MVELISEDFCTHTKIVLAPRQGQDIRNVKAIPGGFASVVAGIAKLKSAENVNLGQSLLGAVRAVYPDVLIGERPSCDTLTRIAREAKAELVDRSRREDMSLGYSQIP